MATELPAVRVKSLLAVLEESDPVEYVHELLNDSSDTFLYVRTPDGFRCDYWNQFSIGSKSRAPERMTDEQSGRSAVRNAPYPSYLRLDREQIQVLLARGIVTLETFNAGALFLRLKENQALSIDFDSQFMILSAKLEPESRDIGYATPSAFDPAKGHCMMVKSFDRRSKEISYGLHGVSLKDLYIGTVAPVELHETSMDAAEPWDPYSLEESSPLMHAILKNAFDWRDRPKAKMTIKALSPKFEELNAGYEINPKPFNNGRDKFAAKLTSRFYERESTRQNEERKAIEQVPVEEFFEQSFVNALFARALYAACRWSGAMGPSLGQDPKLLMELLLRLGFWDTGDHDEVSALMFFISGEKHTRTGELDFQH
ncbi:MAG: hypothetical protein ACREO4_12585 [Lysobacter sp.]